MDETVAALDQLDADSLQHVEFLTTYHNQASCKLCLVTLL